MVAGELRGLLSAKCSVLRVKVARIARLMCSGLVRACRAWRRKQCHD